MRDWTPEEIAAAAGAQLLAAPARPAGPDRASTDSRSAGPGALFVGLRGAHTDGGRFAADAAGAGAWGVLVAPEYALGVAASQPGVAVLSSDEPLLALQRLATAWRRHLRCPVVGVTGSTGKTSTKDLLLALLARHRRTVASRANFNTEIGLPLEILAAPEGTEVLVLEMAMRGSGQIAELAAIAEPDVGIVVNIGPVHLELLGTIEAIAAAKAELIAALPPERGTAIVPAGEPLLAPHLRADVPTLTFGRGGDVQLLAAEGSHLSIDCRGEHVELEVPFTQAHLRTDTLAAVGAACALGVLPGGRVEVTFSDGRGQRRRLRDDITLIDDCYNANPVSVAAALVDLAASANGGRRVAVLGDMLELGPDERRFHAEIGERAKEAGVDLLIAVGRLAEAMGERFDGEVHAVSDAAAAAELARAVLRPGDTVLVKGSRGVGLELVCHALTADGAGA